MKNQNLVIRKFIWLSMIVSFASTVVVLGDSVYPNSKQKQIVLGQYSSNADSLKLKAAHFLFDNMEGHSYMTFDLSDTTGKVIPFDVLSFGSFEELESSFKELESKYGTLDFKKRDAVLDDSVISYAFMLDHIDRAFNAWQTRPWAQGLTIEQFCEYILPYRGSNEPLELWREYFESRYDSAFKKMKNQADPIEAACIINRDLMSWFRFDPRFYYHPTDQGFTEMLSTKLGRCEDMTNLTIYAMRANALAVTSDYTPYWANSGNNHAWNAIVTTDGKVIPFMGAEADPGTYQLANKLAKVYRKTYSVQPENLAFRVDNPDKLPKYLASKSYIDVTRDYTSVRDVTVNFAAPDSIKFGYLCVFNSGEWKAIHWGEIHEGVSTFTEMGTDVAYLPAYYSNETTVPAGSPFVLTKEGLMQELKADTANMIQVELASTTKTTLEVSTDGIRKTSLAPGVVYELKYWDNGWQSVGTAVASDRPLLFEGVPSNGLYWLTASDSNKEERIFTLDKNEQVWW